MVSTNFKKEHEGIYLKTWMDYKGLLDLKEDAQHGHQVAKQDLDRVPMIRRALPLT